MPIAVFLPSTPLALTVPSAPMLTAAFGGTCSGPPSPSTGRPLRVVSVPSFETSSEPPRVWASVPSSACTVSQLLPLTATSRLRPVAVIGPALAS